MIFLWECIKYASTHSKISLNYCTCTPVTPFNPSAVYVQTGWIELMYRGNDESYCAFSITFPRIWRKFNCLDHLWKDWSFPDALFQEGIILSSRYLGEAVNSRWDRDRRERKYQKNKAKGWSSIVIFYIYDKKRNFYFPYFYGDPGQGSVQIP